MKERSEGKVLGRMVSWRARKGAPMRMVRWSERSWVPGVQVVGRKFAGSMVFQRVMSIAEGVWVWIAVGDPILVGDPLLRQPPDSIVSMKFQSRREAVVGKLVLQPRWVEWMFMSPPRIMLVGLEKCLAM
jgi:hypothetical protein